MGDDLSSARRRAEETLQLLCKGADFSGELLQENERLRYRLLQLEQEKEGILGRIRRVEEENIVFANRYLEVEAENSLLANLYIATYQLHATLELEEVLRTITEILINLVGSERFALLLYDDRSGRLLPAVTEGISAAAVPAVEPAQGLIGRVVATGEWTVAEVPAGGFDPSRPRVIIPLRLQQRPVGVILIYSLLAQKQDFDPVDHELFALLAEHAAIALCAAGQYRRAQQGLNTMQGFVDLLPTQPAGVADGNRQRPRY